MVFRCWNLESVSMEFRAKSNAVKRKIGIYITSWIMPYISSSYFFDTSFWSPRNVGTEKIIDWALDLSFRGQNELELDSSSEVPSLSELANQCYSKYGFWPISFSWPGELTAGGDPAKNFISEIVPGKTYSFDEAKPYYDQYANSHFGLTFRKAGWDCFRHVEILGAGSIPLMPDIEQVPMYSMIHYPKGLMTHVSRSLKSELAIPSAKLRRAFQTHVAAHLTSRAMIDYILDCSGLEDAKKVLFVDQQLPIAADYLSLLTLIGLKQKFGKDCISIPDVPYLYANWNGSTSTLYGRGFGYSRILDPSLKTKRSTFPVHSIKRLLQNRMVDALIIGSVSRNGPISHRLTELFPPARTVWLHGEDNCPSPREQHFLESSGCHVFVRSISD